MSDSGNTTLIIPGRLPSLNDIIRLSKDGRRNYQPYAIVKSQYERLIRCECRRQNIRSVKRCNVTITWVCKDRRRDKDNIIAGQKFLFDSLQKAGVIENDSWKCIGTITHKFEINKDEKIIVELEEIKDG